jgi:hypothetical protein
MSTPDAVHDHDFASKGTVFIPTLESVIKTEVGLGQEVRSDSRTVTTSSESIHWISGMTKVPENISDVIVNRLQELTQVKAVLMGRSGEIYHVWTMIDDWTRGGRKAVYAAQRELLQKLRGFDLDFYVVPLDSGMKPEELVSGIPIVFPRAELGC